MTIRIHKTGDKDLDNLIRTLAIMGSQRSTDPAFKEAYSAGMNTLSRAYRVGSPRDTTGKKKKVTHRPMRRSVFRKSKFTSSKKRGPSAKVGFNVGRTQAKRKKATSKGQLSWSPHAHLPITGTVLRKTRKGQNRGRVQKTISSAKSKMRAALNPAVRKARTQMNDIVLFHIQNQWSRA